jgi:4-hydroxysphinganine ceramide fatty acyl 2-hydroxylase
MHSAIAMNILKSLAITPKQNAFLDLDRPLIPQILQLKCSKEEYFKQIHIPRYHNKICRFFSQQYLEVLTHTEWWWVPVFWGHIMGWFALYAAKYIGAFSMLMCIGIGIALWSVIEYIVHRFAFHAESAWLPSHPFFYTVHFLMHGVHHFLPTENTRLVLPIVFSGSLAIAVWNIYKRAFPWNGIAEAIFVGTILGYVVYDVGHYSIHNMEADKSGLVNLVGRKLFKKIKANHMAHHYKTPNARFGVSSTFWDAVFGTGAGTYIAK